MTDAGGIFIFTGNKGVPRLIRRVGLCGAAGIFAYKQYAKMYCGMIAAAILPHPSNP